MSEKQKQVFYPVNFMEGIPEKKKIIMKVFNDAKETVRQRIHGLQALTV